MHYLRVLLKALAGIFISLILFLILIAGVVQIPAIQNYLAHKAISWLSNKTNSKIEVGNIGITFPKSVFIHNLFLEDLSGDTLLYAGAINVNLDLLKLVSGDIKIHSLTLSDLTANISRANADSLFNYDFLISAFTDTTARPLAGQSEKKTKFTVDKISLRQISINYNDQQTGVLVTSRLNSLQLNLDHSDLDSLNFDVTRIEINGFHGICAITKNTAKENQDNVSAFPHFNIKYVKISNSSFALRNNFQSDEISAGISHLELKNADANMKTQSVILENLALYQSAVNFNFKDDSLRNTPDSASMKSNNKWNVSITSIDLQDNHVCYNKSNMPALNKSFDANHLNISKLTLKAGKVFYSDIKSTAAIRHLSFNESGGMEVNRLSGNLNLDEHSASAYNLNLRTAHSEIKGNFLFNFFSLGTLKDSIRNTVVNINLISGNVSAQDLLYFSPKLIFSPFFSTPGNYASVSGSITGTVNKLYGNNFKVVTASKTFLKSDFYISGLPDIQNAYYYLPAIQAYTSRSDISLLFGNAAIPEKISVPQHISLSGSFKGGIKDFNSTVFVNCDYGNISAALNVKTNKDINASAEITGFNLGLLLKDTIRYGRVSLNLTVDGNGITKNTFQGKFDLNAPSIYFNRYRYHNLSASGSLSVNHFDGKITLNDSNAAFVFNGLINTTNGNQVYNFSLEVKGADLKALNLTEKDLRIAAFANANLSGKEFNALSGDAVIQKIMIAKGEKVFKLDSLVYASVNESGRSELKLQSALIGIKYNGTFSPEKIASEIRKHLNNYFPFDTINEKPLQLKTPQNFSFEIELHNHPVLSEVFFPKLTVFEPGTISGNFDNSTNKLIVNASINNIEYDGIQINDLNLKINSKSENLTSSLTFKNISANQIQIKNFELNSTLKNHLATLWLSISDNAENKKFRMAATFEKIASGYKIAFNPDSFYLQNRNWKFAPDNYIVVNNTDYLFHNVLLQNNDKKIIITSVNNRFNDDISIVVKNFDIAELAAIVQKDTLLAEGNMTADVLLKSVKNEYGIIANAELDKLKFKNIDIGTITLKAINKLNAFNVNAKLKGNENDITLSGDFNPKDSIHNLNLVLKINSLSAKTIEAFSLGAIKDAEGKTEGEFTIAGAIAKPEITGNIRFIDFYLRPVVINNRIHFKNETIKISPAAVQFKNFSITDEENNSASINGIIKMSRLSATGFDLTFNTENLLVFNTTEKDNKTFYGRMIIGGSIYIGGTTQLPEINSKIKLQAGTNFTFAVPENKITADKGEGIVLFTDSQKLHPILLRNEDSVITAGEIKGFEIFSTITVGREATLRLLIDPQTNDSLVVKGDAALSFSIDKSGKVSLTGGYTLTEGSYMVSLQSFIRKKFSIEPGSVITWNGGPLDADVDIKAIYTIRTTAIDLVADQTSSLSDADKNAYRQRLPFNVYLKMSGTLMHPEINFEIQLPAEEKGALGGTVNARLNQLNENESALNKQVFALLVLGRFVRENPLESEGNGGAATIARNSVSSFLSSQLNQLGAKFIQGAELNFNVQSYDDFSSGQAEGRTEVEVGVRKQLFNERLTVQVGGTVDVEGEHAKQNNASDITGDIAVEYKITEDGRYRLKGFRQNMYQGILEGQVIETGAGILYTRDFDKWKEFFKAPKRQLTKE